MTLGHPEAIVASATVLPAYLRFRSSSITIDVLRHICGANTAGIAQTLRIAPSQLHAIPQRRLCHTCIEEDLRTHGVAYWHRAHQLPGAFVCVIHGEALVAMPMHSQDKRRGKFFTPEHDLQSSLLQRSAGQCISNQWSTLKRLALLTNQIASTPLLGDYSRSRMSQVCAIALEERKLLCGNKTDSALRAAEVYARHFFSVIEIPELAYVISEHSTRLLWSLLTNTHRQDHPLEYVLLIDWLFGNWETFLHQYSMQPSPSPVSI